MEVREIDDTFSKEQYDRKALHPLQSWEWGEARKKIGTSIVRLGEFNGDTLMDVYLMTLHSIPYTPFKIGYIPRSRFPSKGVLSFLTGYAKKHNIIFIKLEPNENKDSAFESRIQDLGSRIKRSPHKLFPDWTMVLDLSKSEEELMQGLKQKTRYNVRLAQKKGVTVVENSTDAGFETFSKLYFETTNRQKYFGHNYAFHKTVWNEMKDSIAHILIASYENTPLAAYELFYFNNVLYYPYGGSSMEYKNVMAPNLLMWEAIRLGKKLGATEFDMWGAQSPTNASGEPSWSGFTRFKEGYNAQYVQKLGSFDLVTNELMYSLYGFAYKTRWALLNAVAMFRH
jgi:lipid II:glycine glycyltransferase (peptidoglycan interpeptide bridge formation enzyme)